MIRVTGDTHGEQLRFFEENMQGEHSWTKDDYLMICGDFGFVFRDTPYERVFLDKLEEKPYTICFVDGNHENFPVIYSYPKEKWNGGYVHRIRKNIVHLMRGQVYTIEGKTFFTMGGGYSRDRMYRTPGVSWWPQEMPNNDEYREATQNLKEVGNKVDYILSHTAPKEVVHLMGRFCDDHEVELNGFFDWVMYEIDFKRWYFGHWHTDSEFAGGKFRAVWYDVCDIE